MRIQEQFLLNMNDGIFNPPKVACEIDKKLKNTLIAHLFLYSLDLQDLQIGT